jgi:hypothetical protein
MRWLAAAVLLLAGSAAFAQADPEGFPDPGNELVDREFGVVTREFGLDRQVEMYQWRATGDGYERVWNGARIDSSAFAPGHENPPALPLENRRWWAGHPLLDGKPIDPDVLRRLGQWRVFRPNFSRLPANLAAAFQPEGDGLGSAENPLDPQIGDLRVGWRELVLPPLAGEVVLRDGVWQVAPRAAGPGGAHAADPQEAATASGEKSRRWWLWAPLAALLIASVLFVRRRSRKRQE